MNKFKKVLLTVIATAGVSCLAGAAACSQAPDYYKLTFEGQGLDFVLQDKLEQFVSGGTVKEGVEVRFKVSVGSASTGDPVILLNGEPLTPDEEGVYSFVMNGESAITAEGVSLWRTVTLDKMQTVEINADGSETKQEVRINYYGEDGKELGDEVKVVNGGGFKFKLGVSPYYVREKKDSSGKTVTAYTVSCNSEILDPDDQGFYTVTNLTSNATVTVSKLEQDDAFPFRKDGGTGTATDPYKIERPIDLFYMAALINGNFWTSYADKYYEMTADIDMEGEQLYVIGDNSSSTAVFFGHFDGGNHKIKNFYITDEVIDQQTFAREYLPYVGLFGCVQATLDSPATIKNVVLEDYEVSVHPGASKTSSFVGSLVGFGTGVQITGCTLNGEMTAVGDDNQMIYMGGAVGLLQSAYYDNGDGSYVLHDSYVRATLTDINIMGSGSPRCAGGIVGYLVSSDVKSISYVANCTSLGDVVGGMHTGGIVGTMGNYTSVVSCYASGGIISNNNVDANVDEDYRVAYSGGIVGFAEANTVIADCYSESAYLEADTVHDKKYAATNPILAGGVAVGYFSVDSYAPIVEHCESATSARAQYDFVQNLGWRADEWNFEGAYPVPVVNNTEKTVTITVKHGNEVLNTYEKTASVLTPLSRWYLDGDMPEYYDAASGERSWGYYFKDESGKELTRRVSCGFVPQRDMEVYVGLADYSDVAGTYYIGQTEYSRGARFTLNADGTLDFRYGGMSFSGYYEYDGEKLYLLNTCFASLEYAEGELDGTTYYTLFGEKNGTDLTLSCTVDVVSGTSTVSERMVMNAVKAISGFGYGKYTGANGETFIFEESGSGTYSDARGSSTFTYTYDQANGKVALNMSNGATWNGEVVNGNIQSVHGVALSKLDNFAGTWSKNANSSLAYSFDGLGSVTYNGKSGTYEVAGDAVQMTFGGEVVSGVLSQGKLVVDGTAYSLGDAFTGKWYFKSQDGKEFIELALDGMNAEGYGNAVLGYTTTIISELIGQYDVYTENDITHVRVYVGDLQYGDLTFDSRQNLLSGAVYSLRDGKFYSDAAFKLSDVFEGTWASNAEGINTVTFNGKGAYTSERGTVTVTTPSNAIVQGTYSLSSLKEGVMTVGSGASEKTYTIKYDEDADNISFTPEGETTAQLLVHRDSWYGIKLYDGQGARYEFDGKGLVTGTMSVSDGNKYSYSVVGDGELTVTVDGSPVALTAESDGTFKFGDKALKFNTGFANVWVLGESKGTITISEVNSSLCANVTYSNGTAGETVVFTYNPVSEELTYSRTAKGLVITTTIVLERNGGLSIYDRSVNKDDQYSCVDQASLDGWNKTYVAEDGSSITFDGLGNTGTGGTALYTVGGKTVKYAYSINSFGVPFIVNTARLFVKTEGKGFVANGETTAYDFVVPDALYQKTVLVTVDGTSQRYEFDGLSTLYKETDDGYEVAYKYTIVSETELELTDAAGAAYKGTLASQGFNTVLTIEAK